MEIFSDKFILFSVLGYDLSLVELAGVLSGLLTVVLAARERVSSWPIGLVNAGLIFWLLYQKSLYSGMLLQVFFIVTTAYGWWRWVSPRNQAEAKAPHVLKISFLGRRELVAWIVFIGLGTLVQGTLAGHLPQWLPGWFKDPPQFPYLDAFTLCASIAAQILLTRKKVESWALWLVVDLVSIVLYGMSGTVFLGLEYIVFGLIALGGLAGWLKEFRRQGTLA